MAHLLVVELPGGNDVDILMAAKARGDVFSFLTADLSHYQHQPDVWIWVSQACHFLDGQDFDPSYLHPLVQAVHERDPIEAVLCLQDVRLVESSVLAKILGLRYLNPKTAQRLRDKYLVRQALEKAGIEQPEFALATSNEELQTAVDHLGLPVLIKPADGYGSQNVIVLQTLIDLDPWMTPLDSMLPSQQDYGLGVKANDRLLVERFMTGRIIGCDTFSRDGHHQLLGVNEKVFFEPPSFAIKGGCFKPNIGQFSELQNYVAKLLDAVEFDVGAAHIEIMVTDQGYRLIEINPRLVGAKIGRLISHALGFSIHQQLIALHLGRTLHLQGHRRFASTRWLVANQEGQIERLVLPNMTHAQVLESAMFKNIGDHVRRPIENVDRIGYVMTSGDSPEQADVEAEAWISSCEIQYKQ